VALCRLVAGDAECRQEMLVERPARVREVDVGQTGVAKYHLRKLLTKLEISSRNELHLVLPGDRRAVARVLSRDRATP
jgi:hypothetical protein